MFFWQIESDAIEEKDVNNQEDISHKPVDVLEDIIFSNEDITNESAEELEDDISHKRADPLEEVIFSNEDIVNLSAEQLKDCFRRYNFLQ